MFDTINRLVMASIGAVAMTRDRAEQMFDDMVRRGQAERGGRERFVDEMMSSAQQTRRELEDMVARQVRAAVASLNLATREDIARLEAKLDRASATPMI